MMTDQVSQQLRRHLLETADERAADGQLEAVLGHTAVQRQQRPWQVWLRWRLDPGAPFENAALRYGLLAVALLIVAAMIAVLAGGGPRSAAAPSFEGRWTSIDTADGSAQTLVVGPGQSPVIHFEDDFSVNCQRQGDSSTHYVANGAGQVLRSRLTVRFPTGGCVTWKVSPYDATYEYDPETDTLLDYQDITWHRLP